MPRVNVYVSKSWSTTPALEVRPAAHTAVEAANEFGYADLSRPQLCVSWPSGLLAVAPGRLAGRKRRPMARHGRLGYPGRVYVSNEGDVNVRSSSYHVVHVTRLKIGSFPAHLRTSGDLLETTSISRI